MKDYFLDRYSEKLNIDQPILHFTILTLFRLSDVYDGHENLKTKVVSYSSQGYFSTALIAAENSEGKIISRHKKRKASDRKIMKELYLVVINNERRDIAA